jgi:hypothetical protein
MRIESMTCTASVAVFLGAMLATPTVAAEPATSDDASATKGSEGPSEEWYGLETLVADGVSDSLLVTGLLANEQGLATAWMISFPLATPTLHAIHRQPLKTGISFGMRLALPILGGLFSGFAVPKNYECGTVDGGDLPGGTKDPPDDPLCPPPRILLGAAIGGLVATAFDAGYLAYEDVPVARGRSGSLRGRSAAFVAPSLAIRPNALALGLVGGF